LVRRFFHLDAMRHYFRQKELGDARIGSQDEAVQSGRIERPAAGNRRKCHRTLYL
jgi:hypothetical protein